MYVLIPYSDNHCWKNIVKYLVFLIFQQKYAGHEKSAMRTVVFPRNILVACRLILVVDILSS